MVREFGISDCRIKETRLYDIIHNQTARRRVRGQATNPFNNGSEVALIAVHSAHGDQSILS